MSGGDLALRGCQDGSVAVSLARQNRRMLEDFAAARPHRGGKPARIVQRVDDAGMGGQHAADEITGACFLPHLIGVEYGQASVAKHVARGLCLCHEPRLGEIVVGTAQVAGAGKAGIRNAKSFDIPFDAIHRIMPDAVHAPGGFQTVVFGDVA